MMSGRPFNPAMAFPCYGSVVARERGYHHGLFPFVQLGRHIDRRFNGGVAGFLGDQYNPFEVPDGGLMCVMGRNGVGKTTLLNAIMGVLQPTGGRVQWEGRDLTGLRAHDRVRLGAPVPG